MAINPGQVLLIVAVIPLGIGGCSHPQPVRDVAQFTQEQLATLKAEGEIQRKIMVAQQQAIGVQIAEAKEDVEQPTGYTALVSNDWSAGNPNDRRLGLLNGTRQNDSSILTDPYLKLRDPAIETRTVTADLSGLDKAIASVGRLTSNEAPDLQQLSMFASEIFQEYQKLQNETKAATGVPTEPTTNP